MALLERPDTPVRPFAVGSTSVTHGTTHGTTSRSPATHVVSSGRALARRTTTLVPVLRPATRKRVPRWTPLVWLALLADHRRHARLAARSAVATGAPAGRSPDGVQGRADAGPGASGVATDRAGRPGPLGRMTRPAVVAHRGNSSVAPQNTLAAIEAACRAGADAVEIDLQRTADGAAVVIHDDVVDATTDGHGAVAHLSLVQLRALDAGRWFGPAYAGQRVPLLAEVLEILVRYPSTRLLLELKGVWGPAEVRGVTAAIDDAGLGERVLVQSFWPDTVAAARDVAAHLERGLLLAYEPPDVLDVCAGLDVVACNPSAEMVRRDPGIVTRLHRAGLRVMVWTENDPSGWSHLCDVDDGAGVDAIITDRPDRLLGWFSR
ncbi:glycerophosphodiester phosphodiesterase [Myceligenerans salitolerans]|nr:glycerophosphodiester phosphodiesterase family protein [Myceligenerans salitolerans]